MNKLQYIIKLYFISRLDIISQFFLSYYMCFENDTGSWSLIGYKYARGEGLHLQLTFVGEEILYYCTFVVYF